MHRNKSGFTVVELLIVIVVIGILATIVSVAFNGAQQRGRDTTRIHDVDAIATALTAIGARRDSVTLDFDASGAGYADATIGFIKTGPPDSGYSLSIKDWLKQSGYFGEGFDEPKFVYNTRDYAVTLCKDSDIGTNNRRVVMARLENPPSKTIDQQLTGNGCTSVGSVDNWWYKAYQAAPFSMNYAVMVDVQ